MVGCSVDQPTQSTDEILTPAAKGAKKGKSKVSICHIDEEGLYHLISVSENAVPAHLRHGDEIAGGDVLDGNCEPVFQDEITVELPGGATMEFVWIPPTTEPFLMGSPDDPDDPDFDNMALTNEKPQHEVTISQGFYLGK